MGGIDPLAHNKRGESRSHRWPLERSCAFRNADTPSISHRATGHNLITADSFPRPAFSFQRFCRCERQSVNKDRVNGAKMENVHCALAAERSRKQRHQRHTQREEEPRPLLARHRLQQQHENTLLC
ncbi:hypothetical protein SKAU_G00187940 [Synaphobranchus kaupii]|uniref:Uncharacterized protein n=1 Tax=Synaphobranchus kaupii TaxID=118154 RepID=A0A9Q1FDD1_SYNKA|nr:hypothetical protein SKAU_G00187940 [Synaphobranchus kaupii]